MNAESTSVAAAVAAQLVHIEATGLTWDARETEYLTEEEAAAHIAKMNAEAYGGFTNWREPTVEELFGLADRSRMSPAINVEKFPDCKSGWYRTSTKYAGSPDDYAWFVGFSYGHSYVLRRGCGGFLRACRPS